MSALYRLLPDIKVCCQNYWKSVKLSKRILSKSNISEVGFGDDGRPQAIVNINNFQVVGLLDSGANISCLGKGATDLLSKIGLKMKKINSVVKRQMERTNQLSVMLMQ